MLQAFPGGHNGVSGEIGCGFYVQKLRDECARAWKRGSQSEGFHCGREHIPAIPSPALFGEEDDRFFPDDQHDAAVRAADVVGAAGGIDDDGAGVVFAGAVNLRALENEDVFVTSVHVSSDVGAGLVTEECGGGALGGAGVDRGDFDSCAEGFPSEGGCERVDVGECVFQNKWVHIGSSKVRRLLRGGSPGFFRGEQYAGALAKREAWILVRCFREHAQRGPCPTVHGKLCRARLVMDEWFDGGDGARGWGGGIRVAMAGHVAADDGDVGVSDGAFVDELSVEHDDDAVGEFEGFVEVFGDQQDGGAAVSGVHDLRADVGDGGEVEAEAGILCDEDVDGAGEFAGQDGTLHVAAGEVADGRFVGGGFDAVADDEVVRRIV